MFGDFDRFLMRIESKLNDTRYDFLLKPTIVGTLRHHCRRCCETSSGWAPIKRP